MAVVIPDISAVDLLSRFRGRIVCSKPGYPDVLLLSVKDAGGREWRFMTFDADFSPSDPDIFLGKTVISADVAPSNTLTIGFSDGSDLTVVPRPLEPGEEEDDLENWFLITPDNQALDFGPEGRWRLGSGNEPW
jgi:hypothetical protein